MTCGIYLIENKQTKQKYIGQSVNIERRWKEHCLYKDIETSRLERSMKKHGNKNFIITIIEETENNNKILDSREKYWINFYNTYKDKNHYNLTNGGDVCPSKDPNIAKKISQSLKGKKHSEKYKKQLSRIMKDKKIHKGESNPFYGKKHTKETKIKMSQSRKGKKRLPHTEQTKKILSQKQKEYQEKNKIYTLWDIHCCSYDKYAMNRNNRIPNPCGCFIFMYDGNKIINSRFIDFYTPELLYNLTKEFIISRNPWFITS